MFLMFINTSITPERLRRSRETGCHMTGHSSGMAEVKIQRDRPAGFRPRGKLTKGIKTIKTSNGTMPEQSSLDPCPDSNVDPKNQSNRPDSYLNFRENNSSDPISRLNSSRAAPPGPTLIVSWAHPRQRTVFSPAGRGSRPAPGLRKQGATSNEVLLGHFSGV